MTRSRAKAVEEKQQTKVITTAGAKAAATKTTKRKTRADDNNDLDELQNEQVAGAEPKQPAYSQPTRSTRGKAKAAEPKTTAQKDATNEAPKTRTRARGGATKDTDETKDDTAAPAPATRGTRGKAVPQKQAPLPAKRPAKKVTFQDDDEADKENIVDIRPSSKDGKEIVIEEKKASMTKAPKRGRPAAPKPTRVATTGKKQVNEEPRAAPLSPKKATQVAKGNGNDGSYTVTPPLSPVRPLSQSPQEPAVTPMKSPTKLPQPQTGIPQSPIDKLHRSNDGTPVKQAGTALSGSPPKRPPPSPFKASMKESPKKLNLGTPAHKPTISVFTEEKASSTLAQTPARRPPSPIKISQDQSGIKQTQTPGSTLKTSLLQSAAKRPPSGMKPFAFSTRTPGGLSETPSLNPTASVLRQSPQKFAMPSSTSPMKHRKDDSAATPAIKQPSLTAQDKDDTLMDELSGAPAPFTPAVKTISQPREERVLLMNELTNAPAPFTPAVKTVSHREADDEAAMLVDELSNATLSFTPAEKPAEGPSESSENGLNSATLPKSTPCPPTNPPIRQAIPATDATPNQGELDEIDIFEDTPMQELEERTPVADPSAAFQLNSPAVQWTPADESEDELMSNEPQYNASPSRRATGITDVSAYLTTPAPGNRPPEATLSMTGLAERFGGWAGATPDVKVLARRQGEGFVFSPVKNQGKQPLEPSVEVPSPAIQTSSFEEAIQIHEDDSELSQSNDEDLDDIFRQSKMSDASQVYGDENGVPLDHPLDVQPPKTPETCDPQRLQQQERRVLHTVSKVPLKPAADDVFSPDTKANIKKRHSVATALTPRADLELQALREIYPMSAINVVTTDNNEPATPGAQGDDKADGTPDGSPSWSLIASPARTPRRNIDAKLLNGAVVFVDVHTSEGADASGIFVDLLQQMGASVRSSWNWNPSFEHSPSSSDNKVGITHVVFKDGGKRTMEKVRMTKGVVSCVGVGWVLE